MICRLLPPHRPPVAARGSTVPAVTCMGFKNCIHGLAALNQPIRTAPLPPPPLNKAGSVPASGVPTDSQKKARPLRYRQAIAVLLPFGGYGALYFRRADLSLSTPRTPPLKKPTHPRPAARWQRV